jgi:hypothetical protein
MTIEEIKKIAIRLAKTNKEGDPDLKKFYWFPDDKEIRLVETEDNFMVPASGIVVPFYFPPSPEDDLPLPSGVAIIRSEEYRRSSLPENWGSWENAQELEF